MDYTTVVKSAAESDAPAEERLQKLEQLYLGMCYNYLNLYYVNKANPPIELKHIYSHLE